jgi:DNA invertase Pin-like site-specific DNA recombinase
MKQMKIGYARVSKTEQNLDLQLDALRKAGCEDRNIFKDKLSGAKDDRPGLDAALDHLIPGDVLVVYKVDRLGRSLKHLIETIDELGKRGVQFVSLNDPIDTTTAIGKMIFQITAVYAEFERNIIRERTRAGLAAARARGRLGGRPSKMDTKKIQRAQELYANKSLSIDEICASLKVGRTTLYKYLALKDSTPV